MKIQLVLSDGQNKVLEEIMEQCSIKTKTACINSALSLLQWAVGQLEEGRSIVSQKEGERDRELAMPWLNVTK